MLFEIRHTITVRLELVRVLKYLSLRQLVRNFLKLFVLSLVNLILKLCYLDRVINVWIRSSFTFQLD